MKSETSETKLNEQMFTSKGSQKDQLENIYIYFLYIFLYIYIRIYISYIYKKTY